MPAGELYRVPNDELHQQTLKRGKAYISELFEPVNLKDETLMSIAEKFKDPECDREKAIEELREAIPHINFSLIADLCMFMTFEQNIEDHTCWKLIEEIVIDTLALYNFHDLCRIQYASSSVSRRSTSSELTELIEQRVLKDIEQASSYDLMYAMQCYRKRNNHLVFDKGNLHSCFISL